MSECLLAEERLRKIATHPPSSFVTKETLRMNQMIRSDVEKKEENRHNP